MDPESKSCWECLRRRVVCDATRPTCKRCSTNEMVCPGYGNNKPLKWLAPGRVTSRSRKPAQKRAPTKKTHTRSAADSDGGSTTISSSVSATSSSTSPGSSEFCGSSDVGSDDAYDGTITRRTRGTENMRVPAQMEFRTHSSDILQAVYYFNHVVFPEQLSITLGPSPFIKPIPLDIVHLIPNPISSLILSMALNSRIFHLTRSANHASIPELRSRLQGARVAAIECLNGEIVKTGSFCSDTVIVSVLVFLYVELEQCEAHDTWKYHMDGFSTLVGFRGGLTAIARESEFMRFMLVCFAIVQIFANATSPPGAQIDIAPREELLEFMSEYYEGAHFPSVPCPLELFLILIQANHIRCHPEDALISDHEQPTTPDLLLHQLQSFSPETWSLTKPEKQEQWRLLARMYQSAMILYLLSALRNLLPDPPTREHHTLRVLHASRLFLLLEQAEQTPAVLWGCAFPLAVAGVEAKGEHEDARAFVRRKLTDMGRQQAICLPRVALRWFEGFWASDRDGWDGCFVQPCAFVM